MGPGFLAASSLRSELTLEGVDDGAEALGIYAPILTSAKLANRRLEV
jgi:hypothetical protein